MRVARKDIVRLIESAQSLMRVLSDESAREHLNSIERMLVCEILVNYVIRAGWEPDKWQDCLAKHMLDVQLMLRGGAKWDAPVRVAAKAKRVKVS